MTTCSIEGCSRQARSRGWCNAHYSKWQSYGNPTGGLRSNSAARLCEAPGCSRKHVARGYCGNHYGQLVTRPEASRRESMHPQYPPATTQVEWLRAAARVAGDSCIKWPFGSGDGRYGRVAYDGQRYGVHVLVCEWANGPRPGDTIEAAHACGNSLCCNPRHVRWATKYENSADKKLHQKYGRGTFSPAPVPVPA